jgi:hypothetical protein
MIPNLHHPGLQRQVRQDRLGKFAHRERCERANAARSGALLALLKGRLAQLEEAHPDMAGAFACRCALRVFVLVGLQAVYAIDWLMFGAVAQFFALRTFHDAPLIIAFARFGLPAAILILEMTISIQIYFAWEAAAQKIAGAGSVYWWSFIGLLVALVMPGAVVATYLASDFAFASWVTSTLLMMLVGLALAAHLSVISGGRLIFTAFEHFAYSYYAAHFQRRARRAMAHRELHDAKARYWQLKHRSELEEYDALYPGSRGAEGGGGVAAHLICRLDALRGQSRPAAPARFSPVPMAMAFRPGPARSWPGRALPFWRVRLVLYLRRRVGGRSARVLTCAALAPGLCRGFRYGW